MSKIATSSDAMKEYWKELEEKEAAERDAFFNSDEEEELVTYTLDATYEETIINRLDNILVMNILTSCFLFLLFFYALKRRR